VTIFVNRKLYQFDNLQYLYCIFSRGALFYICNEHTGAKMKIQVKIKSVYGKDNIYPACEVSKKLAALSGHTTLTQNAITIIKALGYAIEVIQETKEL
jgi:hypothetical protein